MGGQKTHHTVHHIGGRILQSGGHVIKMIDHVTRHYRVMRDHVIMMRGRETIIIEPQVEMTIDLQGLIETGDLEIVEGRYIRNRSVTGRYYMGFNLAFYV